MDATRTWMSGARLLSSSRRRASVLVCLVASTSGCFGRGDSELLEAHLRKHEDQLTSYQRQITELKDQLATARAESDQLRRDLVALGREGRQEASEPLAKVSGIQFNAMMTGGRDADGQPGHDIVTAVLFPHDAAGEMVKLGGELEIEMLDLSRSGAEQRMGIWKYSANQARELWHSGFLASGFQVDLPVGTPPRTGEILLHGRLVTPDGRQFDTTCPIKLVSAQTAAGAPKSIVPVRGARPVSQASPTTPLREVKTASVDIIPAKAEQTGDRKPRPVETAAFAMLENEMPAKSTISRPAPMPVDLPATATLPEVNPGITPRPFPAATTKATPIPARPFPVQTSDNYTDATIPQYR